MKCAWRNNILDRASSNSAYVEKVNDGMKEYEDLLAADKELGEWDQTEDENLSWI
jgi:hypothetical protein